ncbi:hypothetical protein PoB_000521100 [Plakobranchus ocellatus]|uniref:Uncharacterized protein n=1 Tax=Plakobranchus ocellatus TaxID=259542 RepID=A0AAV3Y683_9GAST|nr:hypothetical protein PoB_000521100 [Plakobranchus ocellatus]
MQPSDSVVVSIEGSGWWSAESTNAPHACRENLERRLQLQQVCVYDQNREILDLTEPALQIIRDKDSKGLSITLAALGTMHNVQQECTPAHCGLRGIQATETQKAAKGHP